MAVPLSEGVNSVCKSASSRSDRCKFMCEKRMNEGKKRRAFLSVLYCGDGECVVGFVVWGWGVWSIMIQLHIMQITRTCKVDGCTCIVLEPSRWDFSALLPTWALIYGNPNSLRTAPFLRDNCCTLIIKLEFNIKYIMLASSYQACSNQNTWKVCSKDKKQEITNKKGNS